MRRAVTIAILVLCAAGIVLVARALTSEETQRGERSETVAVDEPATRPDAETDQPAGTDPEPVAPEVSDAEPATDPEKVAKALEELRPAEGVVAGKVLVKGVPVPPGVQVSLRGGDERLLAQTDENGAFRFEQVPPGDYELSVQHGDYAPKRAKFSMEGEHGAGPFELSLKYPAPPAGIVLGKVSRAADGELLPDADVVLRKESRPSIFRDEVGRAAADARGEFRFEGLLPGRYQLTVTHPGLALERFNFDLKETEGAGPFDVQLNPGGSLSVRVRGAWEAPVPDQLITLEAGDSRTGISKRQGRTDADGQILFENLPPGSYWVRKLEIREEVEERPNPGGGTSRIKRQTEHGPVRTVTVHESRTAKVVFEVGCGITGVVLGPDGKLLPRVIVRLRPAAPKRGEDYRSVQTYTDAEGRFELSGFPAGSYKVSVQTFGKGGYVVPITTLEFKTGDVRNEELRIPDSAITGRIVAGDTGKPFDRKQPDVNTPQAQARLVEVEDGKVVKWLGKNTTAFADPEGRFRLVGVEPGMYWIWFPSPSPDYRDATKIVDFTAGGKLEGVNIRLEPRATGTLRLTVLEPDGTTAAGVYFSVKSGPNSSRTLHGKQVDDGVWDFPLEVGAREVYVYRKGFVGEVVKLAVPEGGTVERTVKLRVKEAK